MTVGEDPAPPAPKRSRLSLNKGFQKPSPRPAPVEKRPVQHDVAQDQPSTSSGGGDADHEGAVSVHRATPIPESPCKSLLQQQGDGDGCREKPVIAAFNNLGNTCFLNSVLQILRYTPGFVSSLGVVYRELLSVHKQKRDMAEVGEIIEAPASWRLVRCLHKLYCKMDRIEDEFTEESDDGDLAVQPTKLLDVIRELNPMYDGNYQHDAQELLHCVLCYIKEAVHELVQFYDQYPRYHCPVATATNTVAMDTTTVAMDTTAKEISSTPKRGRSPSENLGLEVANTSSSGNDPVAMGSPPVAMAAVNFQEAAISDAIGEVVVIDVAVDSDVDTTAHDVTDYDINESDITDSNLNSVANSDEEEEPCAPEGFPLSEDLFEEDESEGRLESSMEANQRESTARPSTNYDGIDSTINSVLRGDASVDWCRLNDDDEVVFALNLDNPSNALCDENLAIAESLKDAAAMASVASAFSDGKLTPKATTPKQTPKSSPRKTSTPSSSPSISPTVVVEVRSQGNQPQGQIRRAQTSSSAIKVSEEIEVLEDVEERKLTDTQDPVFPEPVGMRGGARRETKVARRVKTSTATHKVKKTKKGIVAKTGLRVCNGEVLGGDISEGKLVEEIQNGYHGKENIPVERVEAFPSEKVIVKKRVAKEILSPVRRSPRKLNQKKSEDDVQGVKLDFNSMEAEKDSASPCDSIKSGPVDEQSPNKVECHLRKRVLSPAVDESEPRCKRHSSDEPPRRETSGGGNQNPNQTTVLRFFPKSTVVRRLGMHGAAVRRRSKSPEQKTVIDLTESQSDHSVHEGTVQKENQDFNETSVPESVETDEIIDEENNCEALKQNALDNNDKVKVRLEKCNLKEKYPNLKVSVTPPKRVLFEREGCELVENLFEGKVSLRTRCLECESWSDRVESFQNVSVPVKRTQNQVEMTGEVSDDESESGCSVASEWMLKELSDVEHLRDENKYYCEACGHLVEAERSTHYDVMPNILTLHLKRFAASASLFGGLSKITDHVSIPLSLPCFSSGCAQTCLKHRYELYGVILHSGVTITSGHYVSYARLNSDVITPRRLTDDDVTGDVGDGDVMTSSGGGGGRLQEKRTLTGRWIECDDDQVKVLSDEDFDQVLSESNFGTPYVLFYSLRQS